ncbi:transcriptional regulator [Desulfocucumis palustris]|uniref:Transcriptional regulator n=1 Tax=Desulfocucumis palustris TaxID=1898651 RepID=A0A2L2X7Z2_9FIRM|nr:TetR/AcrR family transcriptional regulator [Desulfocucumis palustris]GBF32130.1 transcriptional regulator [Desulfocucumis palustris]
MKKDIKKDLIADAAMACFLSSGYSGTSVDDIVRASGVSKGGIYWHFKSKEEIFIYLAKRWVSEWNEGFLSRMAEDEPATAKLNKFVDYFIEASQSPIPSLFVEFMMRVRDEEIIKQMRTIFFENPGPKVIRDILLLGVKNGEFREMDVVAASEVFQATFDGISARWHARHRDVYLFRRAARTAINIFLEGVNR